MNCARCCASRRASRSASFGDLIAVQRTQLHDYFRTQIYQVLTPLAVDPGHPFPFISNLSLSLAVVLRHKKHGTTHFARLKVPKPRWLEVPPDAGDQADADRLDLIPIEQVVDGVCRRALPRHGGRERASLPRHPQRRRAA